jgi:hypothetical protein
MLPLHETELFILKMIHEFRQTQHFEGVRFLPNCLIVVEKNLFRWATLVDRLKFSLCIRNSKEGSYSTPLLRPIDPTVLVGVSV